MTPNTQHLFDEIVRYAKTYGGGDRSRPPSRDCAADVMDGWKDNRDPETKELKQLGIIRSCAGSWYLTEHGVREVWQATTEPFVFSYQI